MVFKTNRITECNEKPIAKCVITRAKVLFQFILKLIFALHFVLQFPTCFNLFHYNRIELYRGENENPIILQLQISRMIPSGAKAYRDLIVGWNQQFHIPTETLEYWLTNFSKMLY